MKTRSCLVLLFLLFLAITLGLGAYVVITTVQKAAPAAVSTPVANSTPATTPTPVAIATTTPTSTSTITPAPVATATTAPTLKDTINNAKATIFDPVVALLDFLAVVLITVLVLVVVKLVWDYSGKTNLVIDAFTNASGDDTLDKVLLGLNQLTRLRLAQALEEVHADIDKYNDMGLELGKSPPPETTSNQQLSSLLKSLTDISPGSVKTAVQLLSLVFGQSGTRVVITLHCLGDASEYGSLRMGVEIMDLQGRNGPTSRLAGRWNLPQEVLNLLSWSQQTNKPAEPKKTLEERYLKLVWPVAYWLSVELALDSMEDARHSIRHQFRSVRKYIQGILKWIFKQSDEWKSNYQARLYNYMGYYHLNNAQNYSAYRYDYQLAVEAFKKATIFDKSWFLPYENLGITYFTRAQEKIKQASPLQLTDEGIDGIYEALASLRRANELFQQYKNKQHISSDKLLEMEQFLKLLVCIAQLLSGNDMLINESIADILDITRRWNLNSKINFRLLYNFACWYGVAYSMGLNTKDKRLVDAKQKARRIIVCALARNVDFLYSASKDPSLKNIAEQQDWNKLESILERKRYSIHDPDLADTEDYGFADTIYDTLCASC